MIKENPYIDYDDVAKKLNISNATTRRIFSALRKKEQLLEVEKTNMINGN